MRNYQPLTVNMRWQPVKTAPKDGSVILVNDTTGIAPWVAAKWLNGNAWEGWIYDDELLLDNNPLGPEPTHWLPLPPLPPLIKEDQMIEQAEAPSSSMQALINYAARLEAERDKLRNDLANIARIVREAPELDRSYYTHDNVVALNLAMCELFEIIQEVKINGRN